MDSPEKLSPILYSPKEMTQIADNACCYKANKAISSCIVSAIIAGVFISIAFAFYITATTGGSAMPFGINKLIGGLCFSLGLILVVICGVDLFTSTILTIIPRLTHKITWGSMFRNWVLVYLGNFIGALLFVLIIWLSGEYMAANGQWGLNVLNVASHKLESSFVGAVFLGVLANLMVCLAVWMSYAGKSLTDKVMAMVLPVAMFVACSFEHSIANMFMIPMGITIHSLASPEFWQAINITPEHFAHLNIYNFVVKNLIPVTIGNILGGLMVGIPFWWLNLRKTAHH